MGFPGDFIWGAATSAYQIEGAAALDGKGRHIWDVYCREPGRIYQGHTGDLACDHYHRFLEDVALMKEMGLKGYRFSLDWTRLFPDGTGKLNEKGAAFYSNLIDALLDAGIEPFITLFHWELPYELYKKGGWLNRDMAGWFGDYAGEAARLFGDRVKHFFTMNEPQCFVGLGYLTGEHAPGLTCPLRDTFEMAHNALRAHGSAVQALRAKAALSPIIGYAPTCSMTYPETEREEDICAAREQLFAIPQPGNWTWNVSWWSDPVLLGKYPEEGMKRYEAFLPEIKAGDMELIAQPIDVYGQNIYNARCVRMGEDGTPAEIQRGEDFPRTVMGWPITPEALYWGPKFLAERYHKPIYITENGLSCRDAVSSDGRVHDPDRIAFMEAYLKELRRAADDGVDIRGYFHWSLMDNFEWTCGYRERFGLIYVDYETQKRIWKDSAYWYRDVCLGKISL